MQNQLFHTFLLRSNGSVCVLHAERSQNNRAQTLIEIQSAPGVWDLCAFPETNMRWWRANTDDQWADIKPVFAGVRRGSRAHAEGPHTHKHAARAEGPRWLVQRFEQIWKISGVWSVQERAVSGLDVAGLICICLFDERLHALSGSNALSVPGASSFSVSSWEFPPTRTR